MNNLRSILVHLDGSARAEYRMRLAQRLAAHHQAELTALFAVEPRYVPLVPLIGGVPSMPMPAGIDPEHHAQANAIFERYRTAGAMASQWEALDGEPVVESFVRRAWLSDLLVLGQRDPADAAALDVPADFVESVLIGSGTPALVIPYAGDASSLPRSVLVAWKPTREAAHALAAALPFLRQASRVHLVCAEDSHGTATDQFRRLEKYLALHGIETACRHGSPVSRDAGGALLSLASDVGAEMIVMGCYGHSRARELVLGGVTRTVLASMTVPVLMTH